MSLSLTPLVSLTAMHVPPMQFEAFAGFPPRLLNTHLLTQSSPPMLPPNIGAMTSIFANGNGTVSPVNSAFFASMSASQTSIGASVSAMQTTLTSQISSALSSPGSHTFGGVSNPMQTMGDLQGMSAALNGGGITAIQSQISTLLFHLPTIGGIMTAASGINHSLGLPPSPSFATTFAPFTNGSLNTAVGGISTALSQMATGVSGGLGSFAPNISGLTTGYNSSLGGVNSLLNGITAGINAAVSTMLHLSNASAMAGMSALSGRQSSIASAAAAEFQIVMASLGTPQLLACVPSTAPSSAAITNLELGAIGAVTAAVLAIQAGRTQSTQSMASTINGAILGLQLGLVGSIGAAIGALQALAAINGDADQTIANAVYALQIGTPDAVAGAVAALRAGATQAAIVLTAQADTAVSALQTAAPDATATAVAALLALSDVGNTFLTPLSLPSSAIAVAYGAASGGAIGSPSSAIGTADGSSAAHAAGQPSAASAMAAGTSTAQAFVLSGSVARAGGSSSAYAATPGPPRGVAFGSASANAFSTTASSLIPAGFLSTSGNQIVDANNRPVRIQSIGWSGMGVRNGFPNGLDQANYKTMINMILAAGFNTIRFMFCDALVINVDSPSGINYGLNADLVGKTCIGVLDVLIAYCGTVGLRVILDSHSNEGSNSVNFGANQPNGLWYDVGGSSNNTDEGGNIGTVTDALFKSNWVAVASRYAGNSTVIGYDLRNEPNVGGSTGSTGCTWQAGTANPGQNIRLMYQTVGNLIQAAVGAGPLIICEGPQHYGQTFVYGTSYDGSCGDLSLAQFMPVVLTYPNKVVYSVHEYPAETSGNALDVASQTKINNMAAVWGYLVKNNVAPVWLGEFGSYFNGTFAQQAASTSWMTMMIRFLNGTAINGPTFSGTQQAIGWDWWSFGVDASGGAVPDFGYFTAFNGGSPRPAQAQYVTQVMTYSN